MTKYLHKNNGRGKYWVYDSEKNGTKLFPGDEVILDVELMLSGVTVEKVKERKSKKKHKESE